MYGDAVEKGRNSNGVGKSLFALYLENILFKEKSISPSVNCMWGHANVLTLEEQKDNF